jgi:acyl-CoA synthetase (AMP-forming)/AMP-acid ligase II
MYILDDAQPRMLVAAEQYLTAIDGIRSELETTVERFVASDAVGLVGWESFQDWIAAEPSTPPERPVTEESAAYQMYTSGTTGHPKGAVLTHRAVTANVRRIGHALQLEPAERSLVVTPLFHASALPSTFSCVSRGGCLYIQEDFYPSEVVRALSEERICYAALVLSMIQACLVGVPDVAERSYGSLRLVYYGASPIAERTLRRAMDVFRCGFVQSYGMTEATQSLTFLSPADHRRGLDEQPKLLLSAGLPAKGAEIRIVDDNDAPLPNGALGKIVARGPQLMRGYWNLPDESAEVLRGGWLHTGDMGYVDDEGYLYVQDRLKDMIVSGGENVCLPAGRRRRPVPAPGHRRCRRHRGTGRAVGRDGEGRRRAARGNYGYRGGDYRFLPGEAGWLRATPLGGFRRRSAAQPERESAQARYARAALDRPGPARYRSITEGKGETALAVALSAAASPSFTGRLDIG